ncbi:MAG TPA: diaminopimelate epimerase, partial [Longimicrobiales bacterium]|nr:diaminopimelate epimerase [Longimicrobiales bacterium]
MKELRLSKGQALGNDYLVADAADVGTPSAALVRGLCDRHFGLGSDGLLVGRLDAEPIELRIYNPDGSAAEKSGNGLRIFGAWLYRRDRVERAPFPVALPKDTVSMQVLAEHDDGSVDITVAMGRASFQGADVGFTPEAGYALGQTLDLGGGLQAIVNPVSTGNPHCVVFVDALERDDFLARAPRLATHPAFAHGANVQLARVAGPDRLEAWIWERGVGETLASGSSASAVAAAAVRLGLVQERRLTIAMQGGEVGVVVGEDFSIQLNGPAQVVFEA